MMRHLKAILAALCLSAVLMGASAPVGPAYAQTSDNLSGVWQGLFWGSGNAPTEFRATIAHHGARITGSTVERNGFGDQSFPFLLGALEGQTSGDRITMVKTYDGTGGVSHSVQYDGRVISARRIAGTWRVGGASGNFELVR